MGAKKRLLKETRRALDAAERALADQARVIATTGTQLANARADRDRVHEHLAEAGFLRVDGLRTIEDRLQAARLGVIVLDDVHVLEATQEATQTQSDLPFTRNGFLAAITMPIEERLKLEITGEPAILRALAEALAKHV